MPWLGVLGGIVLCFAVIDISFCGVASEYPTGARSVWFAFNLGAVGAQGGLLVIYAVLGPGLLWLRHLVALSLGLCASLLWLLGYFVADSLYDYGVFPRDEVLEVFALMMELPAMFFAGCVPLWILRTLFRWRIERQMNWRPAASSPQLSIAGILAATAVVGVVLSLVRLGGYFTAETTEADWWQETGFDAAIFSGICLFMLPISAWSILGVRRLPVGLFFAAVWVGLVSSGFLAVSSTLTRRWPSVGECLSLIAFIGSFSVFLLGPLLAARCFHCRLLAGRMHLKSAEA